MSIFKRVKDVVVSNLNTVVGKFEDPVKLTEEYINQLEKDIAKAQVTVAKQIAQTKSLKVSLEQKEKSADDRHKQAIELLKAGSEALAEECLAEEQKLRDSISIQRPVVEENEAASRALQEQLAQMNQELVEMRSKKQTLQARAEAAKARTQMNQAISGLGTYNSAKGFSRMETKVNELEARAEASATFTDIGPKSLDQKVAEALSNTSTSEALAKLKAEVAGMEQKN